MAKHVPRRSYQVGSVVERTDGISHVKTGEGWRAEHRHVMELRLGRELEEGEKVFHLDNTLKGVDPKAFNDPRNLAVIKCRTTKWIKLVRSRVLYEPKKEGQYKQYAVR